MSDFIIKDKHLTCEKVLVEVDMPIFFICIDEDKQRYFAMAVNMNSYIVGEASNNDIIGMLSSKITLRDFVLKAKKKWKININGYSKPDTIRKVKDLKEEELPVAGEYFDDESFSEYIKIINSGIKWKTVFKSAVFLNMNDIINKEGELISLEYPVFSKTIKFSLNDNKEEKLLYYSDVFVGVAA